MKPEILAVVYAPLPPGWMRSLSWIPAVPTARSRSAISSRRIFILRIGPGYGPQKNRALNLAHGDWVLSLDADEWIRPSLRAEIQQAIGCADFHGFYIPRINMFCGRFQRYGDAAKDKVLRLFRRDSGKFTDDFIHEKKRNPHRANWLFTTTFIA